MKGTFLVLIFAIAISKVDAQNHTYVAVKSKKNFNAKTEKILNEAIILVDSVINSSFFKEGILNAKFLFNENLSNSDILNLILNGEEFLSRKKDYTLDLFLETYPDQKGDNIGTTYGAKRIVTSQAYILKHGARCYAAHIIHEYCHTIGSNNAAFKHRHRVRTKMQRREKCQSVPYVIGDLARKTLGLATCNCECENYPQH